MALTYAPMPRTLKRAAMLAVVEALFDHVFEQDECQWCKAVGAALTECKRMQPKPMFDDVWRACMDACPPPVEWQHWDRAKRAAVAERGYTFPALARKGIDDAYPLRFLYYLLRDAYGV